MKSYYSYARIKHLTTPNQQVNLTSGLLNFSSGPNYFFTENRYSWISHANLA